MDDSARAAGFCNFRMQLTNWELTGGQQPLEAKTPGTPETPEKRLQSELVVVSL